VYPYCIWYLPITEYRFWLSDGLLQYHSACVQVTIILLNNGSIMQEYLCWQFRLANRKKLQIATFK
jgi:hypothetical protein